MDELRAAQHWINQAGWDVASEVHVVSKSTGRTIDLRHWGNVKQQLANGQGDVAESDTGQLDEATVLADFSLDKLDPTQRAFADRVLKWADEFADVYEAVQADGQWRQVPKLRIWLGGSAAAASPPL